MTVMHIPDPSLWGLITWLIGGVILYYVIRFSVWLTILQRALILTAWFILISLIDLTIALLLSEDRNAILAETIMVGLIGGLFIFVAVYVGEWSSLQYIKRHRSRADKLRAKGNWKSANYHELRFERFLASMGKLKEFKKLGYIDDE